MKRINLIEAPLFTSLLILGKDGGRFDLHNDFDCSGINAGKRLVLRFDGHNKQSCLVFSGYEILQQEKPFEEGLPQTLDNFYRGRFENENGGLSENTGDKKCFYLDFIENQSISILAKNAYFLFE